MDLFRTVTLSNLQRFGIDQDSVDFQIKKRGAPPEGGGRVIFHCPIVKSLNPIQLIDAGLVRRIRGVVYPILPSIQDIFTDNNLHLITFTLFSDTLPKWTLVLPHVL